MPRDTGCEGGGKVTGCPGGNARSGRWEALPPPAWQGGSRNSLSEEIRLRMKDRHEVLHHFPGWGL